jgi:hypothetical protein
MAEAAVATVETTRVPTIQLMKARRETGARRLHDEVIVRREERVRMTGPTVPVDASGEQLDEERAVGVVGKDR